MATVFDMRKIDASVLRVSDQMASARFGMGLAGVKFTSAFRGENERDKAARELAYGQREAARDPRVEAFCVTTEQGICRVVVRRLGSWA